MADATRAFALVLADELARHGVTDAVVSPGARSTPVVLALAEQPGVTVHVRIDERSASYLAIGIARRTERPVPVVCTSGTAAAHLHAAVLEADQSGLPLILLTADRPPELRGIGASQTVDQVGLYGGAVRWSLDVPVAELRPGASGYWRSVVSRAVTTALGEAGPPPGPVHLNLPLREPLAPSPDDDTATLAELAGRPVDGRTAPALQHQAKPGTTWTRACPPPAVPPVELAALLGGIPLRGVLLCGDGLRPADAAAVTRFAGRAGWPVIAEPHSGARRGPKALRWADPLLADEQFAAAHRPDLVVVCGRVGLSRVVLRWLADVPHVVVDRMPWRDVTRTARTLYPVSPSVLGAIEPRAADAEWAGSWLVTGARAAAAVDTILDGTDRLTEPRTARDLADLLPTGAILVAASSMPIRDLEITMRPTDLAVVANRGVSGIDGFVSTVQGVALGHGGRGPVVGLAGDLSLLHDANGLLPGPDRRPAVTYVVVNNDGGGIFSVATQGLDPGNATVERLVATPHRVDLARLAAAYDVGHVLAETARDLAAALAEEPAGVRIVEVRTDRPANAALHRRIREAAGAAVAAG